MAEADFDSGNDSLSPTLSIRLHGSKVGGRFAPDPKLLFTSAKALHRVGGDLRRPHETLLRWDDMEVTPLGAGLIVYSALTIAVLPDERFFQTGRLLEFGEALADEAGIQPWNQFVRDRAPDLAGEVGLRVAFTTFESGSFRFRLRLVPTLQGIAAAVTIMNQGPGAIEKFEDIVLPKAEIALKLGYSYAERYAECLEKYLVIDIVEVPPDPRPFIKPPPIAHRGRRRAD